jgi:translation initiation factor 5
MALINVNCETSDAFYRYKMPSLIAKVEGKGNGIKTVIVNMAEVGKALGRPPSYPCKFFGCELGAQIQIDKNGRHIVNGAHEQAKLQELVHGFIKKFVLCPECDNPETLLKAGKTKISMSCQACGHTALLDMRHKLTTYILRNPPDAVDGVGSKKHEKGGKKGKPKGKETSSPVEEDGQFEEFGLAQQKRSDEDEDWCDDISEDAVNSRMKGLSNGVASLAMTNDSEKPHKERLDMFFKFVEAIQKDGSVPAIARDLGKVKAEAERLDVMDTAPMILAELMYTKNILKEIKEYRPIMIHFVVDNPKGQKALLGAYEIIVGKEHPELLPLAGHILKAFYDADILDEEAILEWGAKVHKKHVGKEIAKQIHEKAAPFVDWLKNAEEESSEEEDGVDVVYSNSNEQTGETNGKAGTNEAKEEEDEGDDIDIDDI